MIKLFIIHQWFTSIDINIPRVQPAAAFSQTLTSIAANGALLQNTSKGLSANYKAKLCLLTIFNVLLLMCMHNPGAVFSVISQRSWTDAFAIWATTSPSSCMTMWLALFWPNTNWSSPFCCVPTCWCKYWSTAVPMYVVWCLVFAWVWTAMAEGYARLESWCLCCFCASIWGLVGYQGFCAFSFWFFFVFCCLDLWERQT